MDEALIKTGTWPNVAIEAGSDPHEVMKRYGVNEHTLRTACYDHERHIRALEELVRELWHLVNNRSGYGYAAALEHIEELGIEVGDD
jgi:hypothetical protein